MTDAIFHMNNEEPSKNMDKYKTAILEIEKEIKKLPVKLTDLHTANMILKAIEHIIYTIDKDD